MDALIEEIETYCARAPLSLSEFGLRAMGDRGFVFSLRAGRQCLPSTVERARKFIAENPPKPAQEDAA